MFITKNRVVLMSKRRKLQAVSCQVVCISSLLLYKSLLCLISVLLDSNLSKLNGTSSINNSLIFFKKKKKKKNENVSSISVSVC